MQLSRTKPVALTVLLVILAGCRSHDVNQYTAPQVTGRVLAADTRQPIAGVRVWRGQAGNDFEPFGPPKGGQC